MKKTAVVLASSEGIGFSAAKKLLEDGNRVVLFSRSEEKLAKRVRHWQTSVAKSLSKSVTLPQRLTLKVCLAKLKANGVDAISW